VKVLGSSTYLFTTNIYDDKGRLIQVKSTNISGGSDIATNQYDFSGKVIRNHIAHQKVGVNANTYQLLTKNIYDHAGRLLAVKKLVNNTTTSYTTDKTVEQNTYDELGQLKTKKLAAEYNSNAGLENLSYDYNIRGWMLGANRDYAKSNNSTTNYFGFDLGYDKTPIVSAGLSLGTYTSSVQYNGNITGMVWKSRGDGAVRKYDFGYDNVNRLVSADFNQYTSAAFNRNAGIDFSVSNLTYDANGNILTQTQKGWKNTASIVIDQLTYNYFANSNKLQAVSDAATANNKLGDFTDNNTSGADYGYDTNGNLITDKNKMINGNTGLDQVSGGAITYNYLNLPSLINVAGSGTISYTYDAVGNKLKKVTTDNTVTPSKVTTTLYMLGNYENDVLQLLPQEEGRIRPRTSDNSFQYDYFIKDHLGNVRMVLTEEQQTNYYPAATLEGTTGPTDKSMINWEKNFFSINSTYVIPKATVKSTEGLQNNSTILNYQNNNGNPPPNSVASGSYPSDYTVDDLGTNDKMYRLNGSTNSTGLGFVIKVMAGDVFDIFGKSFYKTNIKTFNNTNSTTLTLSSLLNAFLATPVNPAVIKGLSSTQMQGLNSGNYAIPSTFFRGSDVGNSSYPQAYINYIFFDDQFRYAAGGSVVQVLEMQPYSAIGILIQICVISLRQRADICMFM
jgi:hypothetical protein